MSSGTVLLEQPESGLPAGLLECLALVQVDCGTAYAPVLNEDTIYVVMYASTVVGTVNDVYVVSLPPGH